MFTFKFEKCLWAHTGAFLHSSSWYLEKPKKGKLGQSKVKKSEHYSHWIFFAKFFLLIQCSLICPPSTAPPGSLRMFITSQKLRWIYLSNAITAGIFKFCIKYTTVFKDMFCYAYAVFSLIEMWHMIRDTSYILHNMNKLFTMCITK